MRVLAVRKLRAFFRAIWSLRHGDVKVHIATARFDVCMTCNDHVKTERGIYCERCGCPRSFLSDLRTKVRIRRAACPMEKW